MISSLKTDCWISATSFV